MHNIWNGIELASFGKQLTEVTPPIPPPMIATLIFLASSLPCIFCGIFLIDFSNLFGFSQIPSQVV